MARTLTVWCVLLLSGIAAADDTSEGRALYDKGMAHFRLEEYDDAIAKWQEGFRIKPVPEFLYNIAQAHRLSKRNERARAFYQKYLLMRPDAPNKTEVLRHIASLDRALDAEQRASTAPPTQPMTRRDANEPPAPSVSRTPSTSPEPRVQEPTPAPAPLVSPEVPSERASVTASAPSRDKPIHKKGWFWGVIGGAAALVIGGVVVGVVVGTANNTQTLPALRY